MRPGGRRRPRGGGGPRTACPVTPPPTDRSLDSAATTRLWLLLLLLLLQAARGRLRPKPSELAPKAAIAGALPPPRETARPLLGREPGRARAAAPSG